MPRFKLLNTSRSMLLIYETNKRKVVPYLKWYDIEKSYDLKSYHKRKEKSYDMRSHARKRNEAWAVYLELSSMV